MAVINIDTQTDDRQTDDRQTDRQTMLCATSSVEIGHI